MVNDELQHIGFLISRVSLGHRNIVDRQLRKLGIHRGQPPVLFALQRHDGMSNSEMAELLNVTPATLTNKIKLMEKARLVIRKRDSEDKRYSRIYLTDKGRGIMEQLRASVTEIEDHLLLGFSEAELSKLLEFIQRMIDNIDRYHSEVGRFDKRYPSQED